MNGLQAQGSQTWGPEADVPEDPNVADSRRDDLDGTATTGVDHNEEFVGRVAGDDPGYAEETGAERRAR